MKEVELWAGKKVMAYQDADLVEKMNVIAAAENLWYQEWIKSGICLLYTSPSPRD